MDEQLHTVQTIVDHAAGFLVDYSFQVLGALIVLVVGFVLGGWLSRITLSLCGQRKLDATLSHFLASVVRVLVIAFAVTVALSKFGITITPLVAALGAVAFGATYAIQGPLSNYGAGFAIIIGRPFVVDDTVQVAGVSGQVESVHLAYTTLLTEDGVRITIPNKFIVGEILHNSGARRIIEGSIGVGYNDDPHQAITVIEGALTAFPQLAGTIPQVGINAFGESAVEIGYRYWVPTGRYIETLQAVNLAVYRAVRAAGISIPLPQRVITLAPSGRQEGAEPPTP